MTPTKETLEVTTAAETASPAAAERPKQQSGGLRSDAVSLEVPVKVHGSRVTEVVRGVTPHTEPFEEETSTMIVFPQGGVLRMSTPVTAGQMMVLTNSKSGHDAICRVVKVRANAQPPSYVEVEFTNRQQGYWGVKFAGDTDQPAKTILPPPPAPVFSTTIAMESDRTPSGTAVADPPAAAKRPEPPVLSAAAKPVTPSPERAPQPPKKESSFAAIGTQEDVQPAAAPTVPKSLRVERPVGPAASLSMSELLGDAAPAPPARLAIGAGVPGELTDLSDDLLEKTSEAAQPSSNAAEAPASSAPQKVFGSRFDSIASTASDVAADAPASSGTNWFLIATGIAALLVVAAGGGFYFHLLPGSKATARTATPPMSQSAVPAAAPASSASVPESAPAASAMTQPAQQPPAPIAAATPNASVSVTEAVPAGKNAGRSTPAERVQTATPSQRPAKAATPNLSAELTAHPVASQRAAADAADAPTLDTGSSANGQLQQLSSAASLAPPPAPALPRIKVGGDVQQPKLISSVMPSYPPTARSVGISGNVVIQASVSTTGVVTAAKVLSGPVMLRQAAVDAVRHWKYQPGTLNGDPVAVDITVTMSFHQ